MLKNYTLKQSCVLKREIIKIRLSSPNIDVFIKEKPEMQGREKIL